MSDNLIERTNDALDGVTAGPWMAGKGGPGYSSWVDSKPDLVNISIADRIDNLADAEFIAAARQLVPDLLAEVVKLRARIEIIRCLSSAHANAFHVIGDVCREKAWLDILAVIERESTRG